MPRLHHLALLCSLFALPALSPAQTPNAPTAAPSKGTVLFDFESSNFDGWTLSGDCWDKQPATSKTFVDRSGRSVVSGIVGGGYLTTLHPKLGNTATGKAVSKDFTIDKPFLIFRIGGGNHPKEACLNLVVDGKVVRSETGFDSPDLNPAYWDVYALIGKTAHLEVVDATTSQQRGYIMVDDLCLTERPNTRKQAILENFVREYRTTHHLPALMAIISVRGKIEAVVADGVRDLSKPETATIYDRVRVGSVSKFVTGTLIGILVERGVIRWDTKVGDVFPEFRVKYSDHPVLGATVLQLLCHRGGMERQGIMYGANANLAPKEWRLRYLMEVLSKPALAQPGEKYIYGAGFTVATAMVERLIGLSYEELISSYLCKPLGVTTFGMGDPTDKAKISEALRGHVMDLSNHSIVKPAPHVNEYIRNDPSGGVYISLMDIALVGNTHFGINPKGNRLIGEHNLQILHSDPFADGTCPSVYKGLTDQDEWLGHAGNTGCGDRSLISINMANGVICFFNTNANALGNDGDIDHPDFQKRLRHIALHE